MADYQPDIFRKMTLDRISSPGATDRIAAGIRTKIRHSLYRFRRIRQDHRQSGIGSFRRQ